jgi:hypothetical protein
VPDQDGWLTEEEVLAGAKIGRFTFVRLRALGFIPKGKRHYLGGGAGTTRFLYPPIAVPMSRRAVELRRAHLGDHGVFWGLWLDDYPVDEVVRWIDEPLRQIQKKTAGTTLADINAVAKEMAREPAKRTSPHRAIFRHLQEQEGRRNFLSWAGATGVEIEPALSLYTADSVLAPSFNKATGATGAPDIDLQVEQMSVRRLRDILANASADEREQARRDCKKIADLVALAETVDWRRVTARPEAAPFERLISVWRSFKTRAVVVPYLIFVRGLPGHRDELDETFASKAVELRALADFTATTPGDVDESDRRHDPADPTVIRPHQKHRRRTGVIRNA